MIHRFSGNLVLAFLVFVPGLGRAETFLRLVSEPGDPLGEGHSYFFTPSDAPIYASRNDHQGVNIYFVSSDHWWNLDFAAPDGEPLVPGVYLNAFGFPFEGPGEPGLSVSGDGRGCESRGSFEVKGIEYGADDTILSFWARFKHHCDEMPPGLTGEIRFEIETTVGVDAPMTESVVRRENLSFEVSATEASGNPVTLSAAGLPSGANFVDHSDGTGSFSWTPTSAQMGTHLVTFHGENEQGDSDSSVTAITVTGLTSLVIQSGVGGNALDYLMTPDEFYFFANKNYDNGVSFFVRTPSWDQYWHLDFAAPYEVPLTVGTYLDAGQFPFQAPDRPGLNISSQGGCTIVTGEFDVKEVHYGPHESVDSFWSTFERYCGGTDPGLFGEIRFNANVIVDVKAPLRRSVIVRHALRIDVDAIDETGGAVELTADNLPQGASFADSGDNTGTLRWTPAPAQAGTYLVTFKGRNSLEDEDEASTRIVVEAACPGMELRGEWLTLHYSCMAPEPRGREGSCSLRGTLRLTNESQVNAKATWVDFFLSEDDLLGPDDVLLNRSWTWPLPAHSYRRLGLGAQLPSGVSGEGEFVIAVIDATGVETECDEAGNEVVRGPLQRHDTVRR